VQLSMGPDLAPSVWMSLYTTVLWFWHVLFSVLLAFVMLSVDRWSS
jgi:hypothetical protein